MNAERLRTERGAMAEAALVVPLIMALVFGVIEAGLFFSAYYTAGNAARVGARAIAVASTDPDADYRGLQAMKPFIGNLGHAEVSRISVYHAKSYKGDADAPCLARSTTVGAECTLYSRSDIDRPESDWTSGLMNSKQGWAIASRNESHANGSDLVGVTVSAQIPLMFGVFGNKKLTATRSLVVPIESRG